MHPDDVNYEGALNFWGGMFYRVLLDVHYKPEIAEGRRVHASVEDLIARANSLAWLLDDSLVYDAMGLPVSFRAWCRFGGINADPDWLRAAILSGEMPGNFVSEDQ